jgi:hypothetical protein
MKSMRRLKTRLLLVACLSILVLAAGCATPWERVSRLNVILSDTQSTGIEIFIVPRDAKGHIVPLTGNLNVKLFVYENPRGCGFCEGEYKQEWPGIVLTGDSYDSEQGALLILPYDGFSPDVLTLCALDVILTQGECSINGSADHLDIGSETFS